MLKKLEKDAVYQKQDGEFIPVVVLHIRIQATIRLKMHKDRQMNGTGGIYEWGTGKVD